MNANMLSSKKSNSNRSHTPGVWSSTPQGCGLVIASIVMLSFVFTFNAFAAEPEKKEDAFRMKTIQGEVTGATSRNISIELSRNQNEATEVLLPYSAKTRLSGYRKISEVRRGDIIRAEAKESYAKNMEGKEVITGTEASQITLIKSNTAGKLMSRER